MTFKIDLDSAETDSCNNLISIPKNSEGYAERGCGRGGAATGSEGKARRAEAQREDALGQGPLRRSRAQELAEHWKIAPSQVPPLSGAISLLLLVLLLILFLLLLMLLLGRLLLSGFLELVYQQRTAWGVRADVLDAAEVVVREIVFARLEVIVELVDLRVTASGLFYLSDQYVPAPSACALLLNGG